MPEPKPFEVAPGAFLFWRLVTFHAADTICGFDRVEESCHASPDEARAKRDYWKGWKTYRGHVITAETAVVSESAGVQSLAEITDGED